MKTTTGEYVWTGREETSLPPGTFALDLHRWPPHDPDAGRCPHLYEAWKRYRATRLSRDDWEYEHAAYPTDHDHEIEPAEVERPGDARFCGPCWGQHLRDGLTADEWSTLHSLAKRQPHSSIRIPLPKLPAAPKPRQEKADKVYARLLDAAKSGDDKRARDLIGSWVQGGYRIAATNGHVALLTRSIPPVEVTVLRYGWMMKAHSYRLELPPRFHLALKRVAIMANERSRCVHLEIDPELARLTLRAGSMEGEAWETFDASEVAGLDVAPAPITVALCADYLDPVCGVWPLILEGSTADDTWRLSTPGASWVWIVMPMRL